MRRRSAEALTFALAAILLALAFSGCGTPATVARKTIAGFDVANVSLAKLGRVAVKQCADKAQDGAALSKCSQLRERISTALAVSIDATSIAADSVDIAEAAKEQDFSAALAPAIHALQSLAQLLKDAGVKLPPLPGVL